MIRCEFVEIPVAFLINLFSFVKTDFEDCFL